MERSRSWTVGTDRTDHLSKPRCENLTKLHQTRKKTRNKTKKYENTAVLYQDDWAVSWVAIGEQLSGEVRQHLEFPTDRWHIVTYLYVRIDTRDRNSNFEKKRKQQPSPGDDASTAEAAPGRVGRDEQGKAHRANTTPNGGPHLELGGLRLKTWSKSDFSIAETWPTYLYIHLLHHTLDTRTRGQQTLMTVGTVSYTHLTLPTKA